MRVVKSVPIEDFEFRGSIKDSDVTKLVRAFAEDPHIHDNEAEALLRLNRSCPIQGPTWSGFLVDVIADYILNQSGPEGYITSEKARWLISKLSNDGWVANRAELDLLVSILGKARWFPLSLATFSLEQVAGAVIHGFGPLRGRHGPSQAQGGIPGTIGESEIALLRVILNAFGGDSALPLTKPEAEILMAVHRAVAGRPLPASWTDLYAKAMANIILAERGYTVPPRVVALRPYKSEEIPASIDEQVAASLGHLRYDYHLQSVEERALSRLERQRIEIVTGETIVPEDAGWLMDRLLTTFRRSAVETAVLAHLDRECLIGDLEALAIGQGGKAA